MYASKILAEFLLLSGDSTIQRSNRSLTLKIICLGSCMFDDVTEENVRLPLEQLASDS